jgi:flagellar FliL protein
MAKKKKSEADLLEGEDGAVGAKSKKKLLVVFALVLALGAGGYVFLGKGGGDKAEAAPKPGAVVPLEAIHLNLAGGHYLKLGLALQATADAHEAPDGSKALDIAIDLLSNRPLAELNDATAREEVKAELVHKVTKAYDHEVMDVYFTEFVTQ